MELKIIQGDITQLELDAIVNAANPSILGGAGVDGAIHKVAGPELINYCKEIRNRHLPKGVPTGGVIITPGFNLPSKYIIHAVGPVFKRDLNPAILLRSAYINSLNLAEKRDVKTIAFPAISTGIYGYPKDLAAKEVKSVMNSYKFNNIEEVTLCYFSAEDTNIAKKIFFKKV